MTAFALFSRCDPSKYNEAARYRLNTVMLRESLQVSYDVNFVEKKSKMTLLASKTKKGYKEVDLQSSR